MKKLLILTLLLLCFGACRRETPLSLDPQVSFLHAWAGYAEGGAEVFPTADNAALLHDQIHHLPVFFCQSVADVAAFQSEYADILSLTQSYDEAESFASLARRFDTVFFDRSALLLIYVPANSGSYRFGVQSIETEGDTLTVYVRQINAPEAVTCDMAGWLLTVVLDQKTAANYANFDASLLIPGK